MMYWNKIASCWNILTVTLSGVTRIILRGETLHSNEGEFLKHFSEFGWAHLIDLPAGGTPYQSHTIDPVMKTYCIYFALFLLFNPLYAEIKNGYTAGISTARTSLDVINSLLQESGWTPHRRRAMEAKRIALVKYITYHDLTENLLNQLETIAPDLYNEIDTIRNSNGKITDVYVRFIPEEEASVPAWGITGVAHMPGDENTYLSEYGERSVSVKVCTVSQALLVLAHEFGHVKYIVPNLASYRVYHIARYPPCSRQSNHIGHDIDDKSGKSAVEFEKRFKASYYAKYLSNDFVRNDSPAVLVRKIRREILSKVPNAIPVARL